MIIPFSIILGFLLAMLLPPHTDPPIHQASPFVLGAILLFGGFILWLLTPQTYLQALHGAFLTGLIFRLIYEDLRFLSIGTNLIPLFYAAVCLDAVLYSFLSMELRTIGLVFWGLAFVLLFIVRRHSLGLGDVLLAPAIGFLLGPSLTAISLFMGASWGIFSWFVFSRDKNTPLPLLFYWLPFVLILYLWLHRHPLSVSTLFF